MRLIFTAQAEESLKEVLDYLTAEEVPLTKIITTRDNILAKAEMLIDNPKLGQKEGKIRGIYRSIHTCRTKCIIGNARRCYFLA